MASAPATMYINKIHISMFYNKLNNLSVDLEPRPKKRTFFGQLQSEANTMFANSREAVGKERGRERVESGAMIEASRPEASQNEV